MSKNCPRCGSKNTHCINRGEQVGDFLKKNALNIVGFAVACAGHPNFGKSLLGPSEEIVDSVYKCESCGKVFTK